MQHAVVSRGFRYDINALRAFAVVAVVCFHYQVPGFRAGFAGVDIFFVISGYFIGSQIICRMAADDFRIGSFWISRIRRLVPALLLVCIACFLWGWFFSLTDEFVNLARRLLAAITFVSNIAYAADVGYFEADALTKPLLHTWTLAVEGQFYVLLPVFLVFVWRYSRRYLSAWLMLAAGASFWFMISNDLSGGQKTFYSTFARLWEFLAGVLAARLAVFPTAGKMSGAMPNGLAIVKRFAPPIAWIGLLAFVLKPPSYSTWPGYWTAVPVLLATVIVSIQSYPAALGRLIKNRLVQSCGAMSYSIYLWHWPVWVFSRQANEIHGWRMDMTSLAFVTIAITFVLSYASWRWVEMPIRFSSGKWWSEKLLVLSYIASIVVFMGLLAAILHTKGLPQRLPSYVARASEWKSQPVIELGRCWNAPPGPLQLKQDDNFCILGSVFATPKYLLWGDSHAQHLARAVQEAGNQAGLAGRLAWRPECEAFYAPEVKTPDLRQCNAFNRSVENWLAGQPQIDTYIVALSWGSDVSLMHVVDTIRQLLSEGKTVIWAGPVAVAGFDVPKVWGNLQLGNGRIDTLDAQPTDLTARLAQWHLLVQQLQQQTRVPPMKGRLLTIDMSRYTCGAGRCYAVRDGKALFVDSHHLTYAATEPAIPEFRKLLANDR